MNTNEELARFQTADGYTLYLIDNGDGELDWVDSLDPEMVDMAFAPGFENWPVDNFGERLDGKFVD